MVNNSETHGKDDPGGSQAVGRGGTIAITVAFLASVILIMYSLIQFWPPVADPPQTSVAPNPYPVSFLIWDFKVSVDTGLFIIVLLAGAVGGDIHAVRSVYWYIGNRNLMHSWLPMYFSLPFMGAAFALLTYLVLRGGLSTALASSGGINPYGLAAIAGLVGLFSREAAVKLRAVFETLLAPAEKGKDQNSTLSVTGLSLREGPGGTTVTIRGTGLTHTMAVNFGDKRTVPQIESDTAITAVVPSGIKGSVPVRVITPAETVVCPYTFNVIAD